jgi:hypothetical protein
VVLVDPQAVDPRVPLVQDLSEVLGRAVVDGHDVHLRR